MAVVLGVIASYLVGAIPFGYLAGKVLKGIDLRSFGSGNVGATNVLRTLGAAPGIAVLLLDAGKGVFCVLLVAGIVQSSAQSLDIFTARALCGGAAICGHDWPIFLRFRGGKGVATGLGVFLALAPLHTLVVLAVFLLAVIFTKRVSVGSLLVAASLPVVLLIAGSPFPYFVLSIFWLVSVVYLHRDNIYRLLQGTERPIGHKVQVSPKEK